MNSYKNKNRFSQNNQQQLGILQTIIRQSFTNYNEPKIKSFHTRYRLVQNMKGSSNVAYSSIYAKDYIQKDNENKMNKTMNQNRGSSLGQLQNKTSFQTTNKQMMKNWGQLQPAKLDNKKLQTLKTHHFTLGIIITNNRYRSFLIIGNYNPSSIQTSHKLFYNQKPITSQASNKQQQSKVKMRMHNHDFKQQSWTNFQSNYKHNFNMKGIILDKTLRYGLNNKKDNNANVPHNNSKKQQKGAIVLGNHNTQMISTNALQFTQKKVDHKDAMLMKQSLQQTSALVLGNNSANQPFQTVNQQYYTSKPIQLNQLPQATIKQLRSTHFNLGSMKPSYQTQTNLYQFNNSGNGKQSNKFQIPTYESGTWVDKQVKFNYNTTNQRQFNQKQVQPYKKHQIKVKGGFQLGSFRNNYQTQFKKNFQSKDGSDARQPNAKKHDNIVIGLSNGYYVSQQKSNFINRDLKQAKTSNQAIKAMNTEDHFKIGGTSGQAKLSTYQDQYRNDIQNTNKMFHNTKK